MTMRTTPGRREAFSLVGETCPAVDAAVSDAQGDVQRLLEDAMGRFDDVFRGLADAVKEQTQELRAALIDACTRALEAEEENQRLKAQIENLRDEIKELENS